MPYDLELSGGLLDGHVLFFLDFSFPADLYVQFVVAVRAFGRITEQGSPQLAIACVYPCSAALGTP